MDTATFDTHQAVKAIIGSGLDDTQAEAIVTTIHKAMHQGLATKSDFVEFKGDFATLNTSVSAFETDMKDVKSDIVLLKADVVTLKADVTTLKADVVTLKADTLVLKWMVGLVIAVEVVPFLKFLFA